MARIILNRLKWISLQTFSEKSPPLFILLVIIQTKILLVNRINHLIISMEKCHGLTCATLNIEKTDKKKSTYNQRN